MEHSSRISKWVVVLALGALVLATVAMLVARNADNASGASPTSKLIAAATVNPGAGLTFSSSASSALPGDQITYTARVDNNSPSLDFNGGVRMTNGSFPTAEVASFYEYIEYYSVAQRRYIALGGFEATKPAYTPVEHPPSAQGLSITPSPVANTGITYPSGAEKIVGTKIARGNLASWTYTGKLGISQQLAQDLTDKKKVRRIRAIVHYEFVPTTGTGRYKRTVRKNFPKLSPGQSTTLSNARLKIDGPGGALLDQNLGTIATGQSVTRTANYTVPVISAKGGGESDSAYRSRLTGIDGAQLNASATLTSASFNSTKDASANERVPVLSVDKSGPAAAAPRDPVSYDMLVGNAGSAAATPTLTDTVDGSGQRPVTSVPGSVEPRSEFTAHAGGQIPGSAQSGSIADTARLTWKDANGNNYGPLTDSFTTSVVRPPDPPDPPADEDPTVANLPLSKTNAFLYEGPDAVQSGVASDAIDYKRGAVVRGNVSDANGNPIASVDVTVKDHPEFGTATSQADGSVYMVVNGGGRLTLRFTKSGFVSVDRSLNVPWDDYVFFDDVVLTAYDTESSQINVSPPFGGDQMHLAGEVNDQDGTRRAGVYFPSGTQATMRMPNGSSQPLPQMTVRVSEFTQGSSGEDAMPAPLPATSAYTWAAEFSADEAVTAGAKSVEFSQTVYGYLDNFVGFDVGGRVPAGTYSRDKGVWVPEKNGRVIKVVAVNGGRADVDADGDGDADITSELAAIGMTEAERDNLGQRYLAGDELWRVPMEHFSPIDWNWPRQAPAGAELDPGSGPEGADDDKPDCESGSVIECQNQVLGEEIGVEGTDETLNYRSSRTSGRDAPRSITVKVTDATPPSSLQEIQVEVLVAGRKFTESVAPTPNKRYTFKWDGRDVFGRKLQGAQTASVRLGYVYPEVDYGKPSVDATSFANTMSANVGPSARGTAILWRNHNTSVGGHDPRPEGLGGWTIASHHSYDPRSKTLHMGDGTKRTEQPKLDRAINTIAGGGLDRSEGAPAMQALFNIPTGVVAAPDGSIYVSELNERRVRKVGIDGRVRTVAGTGVAGSSGDGGPATEARLLGPSQLDLGPDGSLYIRDFGDNSPYTTGSRVRKIDPAGVISTVAGGGSVDQQSSGIPATDISFDYLGDIAASPDGALYISTGNRLKKVTPDGIIHNVADFSQFVQWGIDVAPDGSVIMGGCEGGGGGRVYRLGTDGSLEQVAGNNQTGYSGDGGPASEARLACVGEVAFGPDGSYYLYDGANWRVRRVGPDGVISTVVGSGPALSAPPDEENGPATRAFLNPGIPAMTFAPDGGLIVAQGPKIRRISTQLPGLAESDVTIPSRDGSELYIFNSSGRHLRTVDALTGATLLRFSYDSEGRLTKVTDGDGDETLIGHDGDGEPTQIVGPDGHTTQLHVDVDGYLDDVIDPAGKHTRATYYSGGLLHTFTDRRDHTSTMTYDSAGQLTRDTDAAGGYKDLAKTTTESGREVTMTTALGRIKRVGLDDLSTGDESRTTTYKNGTQLKRQRATDASRDAELPDGTKTKITRGPDPRFGMQVPINKRVVTTTPSGLTSISTASRQVTQSQPGNPLSLQSITDTATLNGRQYQSTFNRSQRRTVTTSPANRTTTTDSDLLGRPLTTQVPGLDPISYSYDGRGRPIGTNQGMRSSSLTYDGQGNVATETDSLGRTTTYTYDPVGRPMTETGPDGNTVAYNYDNNGNLTSLTPPGRSAHALTYNPVDQPQAYAPPLLGAEATITRYHYDQDHGLAYVERPDGSIMDIDTDSFGRATKLEDPLGTIGFAYGPNTGRLAHMTGPGSTNIDYTYDGSLPTAEDTSGAVSGSVSRGYDNDFRVNESKVNGSNTVSYDYDPDGLLAHAGAEQVNHNAQNGLLTSTTLDQSQTSYTYSSLGETASQSTTQAGAPVFSQLYTRDQGGRLLSKTETNDLGANTYAYTYDLAGRLKEMRRNGSLEATYTYDQNGNRTQTVVPGQGTTLATYDAQDRLATFGNATYTHNKNGDLTSKTKPGVGTTGYTYDAFGALRHVDTADGHDLDYVLDGAGNRLGKKRDGNLVQGFLYDQGALVAELGPSQNVVSRFVWGTSSNAPDYMVKAGRTYRIVRDHLGSPRVVVDAQNGAVAQRIDYDVWGNVTRDTAPGFQPFGYGGGLYDQDTKLVRFGARDYDPESGRWTAKDPIGFEGGDPNLYGYVLDDPVNLTDPSGLVPLMPVSPVGDREDPRSLAGCGLQAAGDLLVIDGGVAGFVTGGVNDLIDTDYCSDDCLAGQVLVAVGGLAGGVAVGVRSGVLIAERQALREAGRDAFRFAKKSRGGPGKAPTGRKSPGRYRDDKVREKKRDHPDWKKNPNKKRHPKYPKPNYGG